MAYLLLIAGTLLSCCSTLSADALSTNLTELSQSLTKLNNQMLWPPASYAQWLTQENLISAKYPLTRLPTGITGGIYRIRVMPQHGATCNVNAWYNLAWFTLLLNAETLEEARHARKMLGDREEFEKICNPIAEKSTSGFFLSCVNKEIIRQLPAKSEKYFFGSSVRGENFWGHHFFSREKFPFFYKLFITDKQGAYGFHWWHAKLGGHFIAFVAARSGNEFSFYILDSLNTEGPLDQDVPLYAPIAQEFIEWCLDPAKVYGNQLNEMKGWIEDLYSDEDIRTNNWREGELTIKTIEDQIAIFDSVDRSIFDPSRKAYEQQRDILIAEWQKNDPTITLDTIHAIDQRKRR